MPEPTRPADRAISLDVVRGGAVLGILAMNIRNFALPLREFDNPRFPRTSDAFAPADFWTWLASNVLAEDKMITIFGLLFGAGVVLFSDRLAGAGVTTMRAASLHIRRMIWLLLIGLAHAYLLWYGDILNTYAICGLLLWPLRRLPPATLIALGTLALLATIWIRVGPGLWDMLTTDPATPSPPAEPSLQRRIMVHALRTEGAAYHASWFDLFLWRANLNTAWHFTAGLTFSLWRSLGQMLIGMGLMRLAMFTGAWRASTYTALALTAYAVGLSLTLVGAAPTIAETLGRTPPLDPPASRLLARLDWPVRFTGALGVALGHTCLVLALCKGLPRLRALLHPLACVGRMALTNYLMHTVLCVLIFDGWAGGQWDRWAMHEMYLLVAGVWILQLALSPLWLGAFRFGPAEWAWRSLTYWNIQPLRRATPTPSSAPTRPEHSPS